MPLLDRILAQSITEMADLTARLETGTVTLSAWERQMEGVLARFHTASFLAGRAEQLGVKVDSALLSERRLSREERAAIKESVKFNLEKLRAFRGDIAGATDWTRRFNARAAMYGESAKTSYWRGRTLGWSLPGLPTIGVQCLTRCGCSWEFDGDKAWWRRGKTDSCPDCIRRERDWSPYVMRSAA